ncbi:MAG: hypothetical protein ACOCVG_02540 [Verrucomicrobiota bacterium]
MFSPTASPQIQKLASQIGSEAERVESGSDEALLPLYSLLGDLADEVTEHEELCATSQGMRVLLGERIDAVQPFDEAAAKAVQAYGKWLPKALKAIEGGKKLPKLKLDIELPVPEPAKDEAESPFGEHRPLHMTPSDILGMGVTHKVDDEGMENAAPESGTSDEGEGSADPDTLFEEGVSKIASELVHAMVGSDEAMIPIYSIVNDTLEALEERDGGG